MTDFTQAEKDLLLTNVAKIKEMELRISEIRIMMNELDRKGADTILHLHEIREALNIEDQKLEFNRHRLDNTVCLVKEIVARILELKRYSDLRHTYLTRSVHELESHCLETKETLEALTKTSARMLQKFADEN